MIKKIISLLGLVTIFAINTYCQSDNGSRTFAVLNLYNSAQMCSRGLDFMPRFSSDLSSSITNPALINESLNNQISLTYTDLFTGAYQGALAYSHTFKNIGSFAISMQYINYGTFRQTEANGQVFGTFGASDYLFTIGYGMQVEKNIYIGATFKPVFSKYESYSSSALCFDFGATFVSNNKLWQVSAIAKNIGKQINEFHQEQDSIPFDIQIGLSKQFVHAPIVLYVVANKLTKWNIRENDKLSPRDQRNMDGSVDKESKAGAFFDKAFRHLQFAADIYPNEHFYLSVGYSWDRHQQMHVDDAFSLAGLSYGLGIKYKQFTLNYARNEYHNYGSPNYITLGYNFNALHKEKKPSIITLD